MLDILELWLGMFINYKLFDSQTGITNLSSYTLSNEEENVLSNGLNFCPTPKPVDLGEFNLDLQRFFQKC